MGQYDFTPTLRLPLPANFTPLRPDRHSSSASAPPCPSSSAQRCGRIRSGYSINAQLKAVIDRTVARWLEVENKEFYYIVTMADEGEDSADTTLACFRGY